MPANRGKPEDPPEPGWYPDPWSADGKGERYFDGTHWGSAERPRGRHSAVAIEEPPSPALRPGRSRAVLSVAILVAAVAGYVVVQQVLGGSDKESATPSVVGVLRPPPGSESKALPLGKPASPPIGSGGYEVLAHQPNDAKTPIAFDPCRPIHYVVNPSGAPDDADELLQSALASLSSATGLQFVDDGATTEAPSRQRNAYLPERYSRARWAPVLISWSDEQEFPNLAGSIAGLGAPQSVVAPDGTVVYVSGQVVLDRAQLSTAAAPDRGAARAVLLHELGHLVGLDHTADHDQLMFSESQFNVRDYADGDLRGLAVMGTQACVPEV